MVPCGANPSQDRVSETLSRSSPFCCNLLFDFDIFRQTQGSPLFGHPREAPTRNRIILISTIQGPMVEINILGVGRVHRFILVQVFNRCKDQRFCACVHIADRSLNCWVLGSVCCGSWAVLLESRAILFWLRGSKMGNSVVAGTGINFYHSALNGAST